jgi:rhodanese-related sulfurtransferase
MTNKITLKELQETREQFVIVDVREADELEEESKMQRAINIPLGQLIRKARHGDLDDHKGKKIITYCNSGYRGNIAADELNKQGFDTVTIEGGYSAYKNEGNKKNKDSGNSNE